MKSFQKRLLVICLCVLAIVAGGLYLGRHAIARNFFEKGNYYFSSAHYNVEAAERWYARAEFFDPKLPLAHYQLARLYFVQNRSDVALQQINTELVVDPSNFRSYYIRGLIDLYRKNYTGAVADFEAFLKGKPQSWAALNDLTVAYIQSGDYKKAEEVSRQGLDYFPNNAWLTSNLGVALLNQKRASEAHTVLVSARDAFSRMSDTEWANAYPGNEDRLVAGGLTQARAAIEANVRMSENGNIDEQLPAFHFISHVDGGVGFIIAACGESIGMSVAPLSIQRGQSATLSWTTANVEGCTIDNGVGSVVPSGSVSVSPSNTTTYTLTCNSYATPHAHQTVWTSSATVNVQWLDIKVNGVDGPLSLYEPNTDATLTWQSGGGPYVGCTASGDWSGSYSGSGTKALGKLGRGVTNPGGGKTYDFKLDCGPSDSAIVTVYQIPVCSLTSDKTTVTPPSSATLTWGCQYANAPSCSIVNNQGSPSITVSVINDASYHSGGTVKVRPTTSANYTYSLLCSGVDGPATVSTPITSGSISPRIHEENP